MYINLRKIIFLIIQLVGFSFVILLLVNLRFSSLIYNFFILLFFNWGSIVVSLNDGMSPKMIDVKTQRQQILLTYMMSRQRSSEK